MRRFAGFAAFFLYGAFVFSGSFQSLRAGDIFGRYFRDQGRESIVLDATTILGTRQNGKLYLSEKQAIEMALRHNLDINVQRHNSLLSRWTVDQHKGVYDPVGVVGFNWDRETTPTVSVLQGGPSVTNVLTSYSYGYRQNFSTGSSVEAGFLGARNRTTNFFTSLVPAVNTSFELVFRQSLLQGFGRAAADYQIEIARHNLDISEQEFKRRVTEIIVQVQDRYWELQHALEDIKVREKSLQLANTALDQNRARYEVGTAARLEVVQAEAEVALRQEELIRAQFGYRRIQDHLVKLITSYADPRQFPAEIVPADPVYTPPPVSESFDQLRAMAAETRPEVEQVDLDVANQKVNLELTRDRLRPRLDLVAGYQQFGLGGTQVLRDFSKGFLNPPVVAVIPGGLGRSLSQLFSGEFYGYVLGLNLQLPIFNTEARAQNAQAQIGVDRAMLSKRSVEQMMATEVRDALTQIEMNRARLDAGQAAVRFSRERLEGEKARFEVGMGTTRELIEAQRDLAQAESLLVRAQIDLIKSHQLLDKAVGRTFERYHIRLADALRINVK